MAGGNGTGTRYSGRFPLGDFPADRDSAFFHQILYLAHKLPGRYALLAQKPALHGADNSIGKKVDGKREIRLKDGLKTIKTFDTKVEAVRWAKIHAESQGGTVLIHASKGKNKGKFIKQ